MTLLNRFLDPTYTSLKVCGYTRREDIDDALEYGVHAVGINFWPKSKRYCPKETARSITKGIDGNLLRVGLFVNQGTDLAIRYMEEGLIDIAQFHGDETPEELAPMRSRSFPFIKALGIKDRDSTKRMSDYGASAILLDAHAPGRYGGTGENIDWELASEIVSTSKTPIILAGGITPENAAQAVSTVNPAAIDTASGSEISPGIKDPTKVHKLVEATKLRSR